MPSPSDWPSNIPADPFVIESPSHPSYPPSFIEPAVSSKLKPYINIFRVDPFTTHDGVCGRPVPAPARYHTYHEGTQPIMLEFQLSLASLCFPSPESESNSEGDPTSEFPPPGSDVTTKPGQLRYFDGDSAPSAFTEPSQGQYEKTTWSPAPLFRPLAQPPRQSFSQLDNTNRSPPIFHAPRFTDQDYLFTRVDRAPEPETTSFRSTILKYSHSTACQIYHAGFGAKPMYAPESTLQVNQEPCNGYKYSRSSSNTSSGDGYPSAHPPAVGSHFYSPDDSYSDQAYSQQSFSFPSVRNDASSQHALFATPARMATPSRPEGICPSAHRDPSPRPMPYPGGNLDATNSHALGHAVSSSVEPHLPTDHHYALDSTRLRDGDHRDIVFAQNGVKARNVLSPTSRHQAQPDPTRRLSVPALYNSKSGEAHFQANLRGHSQIVSEEGTSGFDQPMSGLQYNSRSPSLGVFDRRGSIAFDRPISCTSSGASNRPLPDAFSRHRAGNLGLTDPSSPPPPTPCVTVLSRSNMLDRPASRALDPFTSRCGSLDSPHTPGRIAPMRIFDSPSPTVSPTRSLTRSPTPSTKSSLVDRTRMSRGARQFAPFLPGEMNRTKKDGKKHICTVCNKGFNRPSILITHMNTHTGERPHLCPIKSCGRRFSVSSNLKRHVKSHKLPGPVPIPRGPRKKATSPYKEVPPKILPRALQERKNIQPWCPESLCGMRNANRLSSRPPFEMPESAAMLPAPLPVVRPHGHPGDENYEERDSFFYAHEIAEPTPYHPIIWKLHPTLPGPLPSQADLEARARGPHEYGGSMSQLGTWTDDHHQA